jgi:hypothetical protein
LISGLGEEIEAVEVLDSREDGTRLSERESVIEVEVDIELGGDMVIEAAFLKALVIVAGFLGAVLPLMPS